MREAWGNDIESLARAEGRGAQHKGGGEPVLRDPPTERLGGVAAARFQGSIAVGAAFLLRHSLAVAQQVQLAHVPVAGCNDIAIQPL